LRASELPRAGWREWLLVLLGRRRLFRVQGRSMLPTLADGDLVLALPLGQNSGDLLAGHIVVAEHPFKNGVRLIKRIEACEAGAYRLCGDNQEESTDSRGLGSFQAAQLLARVSARA
tara:strand:- start:243 stop:593 length:351 start_codon:yes stop_codon:yes gene_type:complete